MSNTSSDSPEHNGRTPPTGQKISSLSTGAQLFIWSSRQWLACTQTGKCIHQALELHYAHYGVLTAIPLLDEVMTVLAAGARRQVAMQCLCADTLGTDEARLLQALRALQQQDTKQAQIHLKSLLEGAMGRTFCRSASAYVDALNTAQLSVSGVSYLHAIADPINHPTQD